MITRTNSTSRRRRRGPRRSNSANLTGPLPVVDHKTTINAFVPRNFHPTIDLRMSRLIVPARVRVILPYHENLNLAPGTFFQDYLYNLNSIFDPNRTGTGHQPGGHDQWAVFYSDYRVFRVDYKITFGNTGTAPISTSVAATNINTALTTSTSGEQPYSTTRTVGAQTGSSLGTHSGTFNLNDIVGRSVNQYMSVDAQYSAAFGSSPTELIIGHLFVTTFDGANVTCTVNVQLLYHVELYDPIQQAES